MPNGSWSEWPAPDGGWPRWMWTVPYRGSAFPGAPALVPIAAGANCQRYAYAVLELFGVAVPPWRSSELWSDTDRSHVVPEPGRLDLVLFNRSAESYGAHVGVWMAGNQVLHLCQEVGHPSVWPWDDFAARPAYRTVVGFKRLRPAPEKRVLSS